MYQGEGQDVVETIIFQRQEAECCFQQVFLKNPCLLSGMMLTLIMVSQAWMLLLRCCGDGGTRRGWGKVGWAYHSKHR